MSDDNERWKPPAARGRAAAPPRGGAPAPARATAPEPAREMPRVWSDRLRQQEPVSPGATPAVVTEGVARDYPMGDGVVHALKSTSLRIARGQLVAVHGRSGSGKTTLLNLIGGLDQPTSGRVWVDDAEVTAMGEAHLVALRRHQVGFIFQAFGLIPILTAAENVEVPLRLAHTEPFERDERVRVLLELVGLGERARHRPFELSGGEQQRVAIARALAASPRLLLADEPTGQLDSNTGRAIMTLLRALVKSEGLTAIVATHDPVLIDLADRIIELRDGEVIADSWPGA